MTTKAQALALVEGELRRRNKAASTLAAVLGAGEKFLEKTGKPLSKIDARDVESFFAARSIERVSPVTRKWELWGLRSFFTTLVALEVIEKNPAAELRVKSPGPEPQVLLSQDGVHGLLATVLDRGEAGDRRVRGLAVRDRVVLELLYGAGVRSSEVRAALVVDVKITEGTILVRRAKRGKPCFLPLPPRAVIVLEAYLATTRTRLARGHGLDAGALFLTRSGKPLDRTCVWRIVRRAAERAGVRAHPHAFRRAIATHLVRAGVSMRAVQELLGHESIRSTQDYVAVDREELRRAVGLLEAQRS